MWIFKTNAQKIESLEDEIIELTAKLSAIKRVYDGLSDISYCHVKAIIDIEAKLPVLENKLKRLMK